MTTWFAIIVVVSVLFLVTTSVAVELMLLMNQRR